jgi:hypothetical protein
MKNSLFKSLKLYSIYRKIVKEKETEITQRFNSRIDRVYRIYTVLNVPTDLIEEPYNLRKQDIDNLSEQYIREFTSNISKYLNSIGLTELYDLYEVKKVDKYSYLVIIGFSLFRTDKFFSSLFFRWLPTTVGISLLSYLIFKLFS